MSIAVVVPTIREEWWKKFVKKWKPLFLRHNCHVIKVEDGASPRLIHLDNIFDVHDVMGENKDLIYNQSDCVRNLGFAYIAKFMPDIEYIITLDDDVSPVGDTIADHLKTLSRRVPISWLSTLIEDYSRGFPYGIRDEAEVVLSHGLWEGVKDYDAPTQLVKEDCFSDYYVGPIPKGAYYPMCGMNVAFKRKMLPYMYFAPMGYMVGLDRFADIWLGIESKKVIDKNKWAVFTGGAVVHHEKASDVWVNMKKELPGLKMNESYGKGNYFELYKEKRERWQKLILKLIS